MELQEAIDTLINAIENVEGHYILVEANPDTKVKKEQVERSFAYELYHQWSLNIDKYRLMHEEKSLLTLNGEIPKKLGCHRTFPDMVLHGGQSDIGNQLIVCEIKRKDVKYPRKKSICADFVKLREYLTMSLSDSGQDLDAGFQQSVFIMVNIAEEPFKKLVIESLKTSSDLESIKEYADKILCISYNPSKKSKKGEVKASCFHLEEILNLY